MELGTGAQMGSDLIRSNKTRVKEELFLRIEIAQKTSPIYIIKNKNKRGHISLASTLSLYKKNMKERFAKEFSSKFHLIFFLFHEKKVKSICAVKNSGSQTS